MDFRDNCIKNMNERKIETLTHRDLADHAIWEYVIDVEERGVWVIPSSSASISAFDNKLVATMVTLANGIQLHALIGNVLPSDSEATKHLLTLSVLIGSEWFTLSRYHDFDYSTNGPNDLARKLSLPIADVFPISYDLRHVVVGKDSALKGEVLADATEKLTREQIVALALSSTQ